MIRPHFLSILSGSQMFRPLTAFSVSSTEHLNEISVFSKREAMKFCRHLSVFSLLKRKYQTSTLPHIRQLFLTVHIKLHETPLTVATGTNLNNIRHDEFTPTLPKHCRTYWQLKVPSMTFWAAQEYKESTHSPSWVLLMKTCQASHAQGVCHYFALLLDIRMKILWKQKNQASFHFNSFFKCK